MILPEIDCDRIAIWFGNLVLILILAFFVIGAIVMVRDGIVITKEQSDCSVYVSKLLTQCLTNHSAMECYELVERVGTLK